MAAMRFILEFKFPIQVPGQSVIEFKFLDKMKTTLQLNGISGLNGGFLAMVSGGQAKTSHHDGHVMNEGRSEWTPPYRITDLSFARGCRRRGCRRLRG
jgi:hypothetical protein